MPEEALEKVPVAATAVQKDVAAVPRVIAATGATIGALLASTCCIVPLALFALGISGAWIANLTALALYQPIILGLTFVCLAVGFALIYRKPQTQCDDQSFCGSPKSRRVTIIALWGATTLVIAAIAFPYVTLILFEI